MVTQSLTSEYTVEEYITLLMAAINGGNLHIFNLIKGMSKLQLTKNDYIDIIVAAIRTHNMKIMDEIFSDLFNKFSRDILTKDDYLYMISHAAKSKNIPIFEGLSYIIINHATPDNYGMLLRYAAKDENLQMVKKIIELSQNNISEARYQDAYIAAKEKGNKEVKPYLRNYFEW